MQITDFEKKFRNYTPGVMDIRGEYAVLVPLVEDKGETCILYELRSKTIDVQPNEVCFPGGGFEPGEDAVQCALRETFEEIGVPSRGIEVIGELDMLHPASGLLLHPVLGVIKDYSRDKLRFNPDEVGDVFTMPVGKLSQEPYIYHGGYIQEPGEDFPFERMGITKDYKWRSVRSDVVLYEGAPYPIWGLTAMITYWLMRKMREA